MQIEKNVPMPAAHSAGRPRKWPLAAMEVGDSIRLGSEKERKRAVHCAWAHTQRKVGEGKRFASRKLPDGSFRIWRVL